jgi:predicted anti-sigma-YlaC factor YlaD
MPSWSDYPRMTQSCEEMRTALSARMDGEDAGLTPATLDDHLAGCAGCRAWQSAAEQVTLIIHEPVGVPDLTAPILAAVAQQRRIDSGGRKRILQFALGLSAVVQLALAVPALLVPGVDLHTSREAASFDIALAVGFALAAWWPERARAFVPVAFVLAGCLTLTSIFDIAGGAILVVHEISHVAALAQAGLLLALSRRVPPGRAVATSQATVA